MNVFLLEYETRLKSWAELRTKLTDQPLQTQCVEVDHFWQAVPIQTYYLHTDYINDWPGPWQLISDNIYCYYARALGMIYTLLLLGIKDIALCEATDYNNDDVVLVLVDNAKYALNFMYSMELNNLQQDFVVTKTIDILPLQRKLG